MTLAHFQQDYDVLVDRLLDELPEDQAMARAVGAAPGTFLRYGYKQRQILTQYGFEMTDAIVDIGCGSGRLAAALQPHHQGIYAGFDVVEKLIDYASRNFGTDRHHFFQCEGLEIPLDDAVTDALTFFSVLTHLHHEESLIYLAEAARVVRPGGLLVCTYLDFDGNWDVFVDTTIARHQGNLVHANVFMTEGIIRRLVEAAGFDVVAVHPPRDPFITFDDDIEFDDEEPLAAGQHSIAQGVCIARRPGALPEG